MQTLPLLTCTADGCDRPRADQDPKASNRHCPEHRAKAQRKYNETKLEQQHGKGWCRGVEDFRRCAAREFAQYALGAVISVGDVVNLLMTMPGPAGDELVETAPTNGDKKAEAVKA